MCRILQIKSTLYSQQCRYVHINRTKNMPTSSHRTLLSHEHTEPSHAWASSPRSPPAAGARDGYSDGSVSSMHRGELVRPTASSSPSPRRAPLSVRGRRGGTSAGGSRPRCTVCTKPKKKPEQMLMGCAAAAGSDCVQRAVWFGHHVMSKKGKKKKQS